MLKVGALLFHHFELLDVFGPFEFFGILGEIHPVELSLIAPDAASVKSYQGPRSVIDLTADQIETLDILLVPGGLGTREVVHSSQFLDALKTLAAKSDYVTSVCTGSGLLAKAGLLDGKRATSNKLAYDWATAQSQQTEWIREARWVADGHTWTSSGVTAGMDMALALIETRYSRTTAEEVARRAEYLWNRDPSVDPFAIS